MLLSQQKFLNFSVLMTWEAEVCDVNAQKGEDPWNSCAKERMKKRKTFQALVIDFFQQAR